MGELARGPSSHILSHFAQQPPCLTCIQPCCATGGDRERLSKSGEGARARPQGQVGPDGPRAACKEGRGKSGGRSPGVAAGGRACARACAHVCVCVCLCANERSLCVSVGLCAWVVCCMHVGTCTETNTLCSMCARACACMLFIWALEGTICVPSVHAAAQGSGVR